MPQLAEEDRTGLSSLMQVPRALQRMPLPRLRMLLLSLLHQIRDHTLCQPSTYVRFQSIQDCRGSKLQNHPAQRAPCHPSIIQVCA